MFCGAALGRRCSNCGTDLPPVAAYCFKCGQKQGDDAQTSLAAAGGEDVGRGAESLPHSFISRELADKFRAARERGAMEGERRVVTILFCDVQGSTAAADSLDPEEWAEIMNGAFERMIRPVYAYEGIVARLMGDAILAFFGAPIAHEDDPQRAILAALQIVESVRAYRRQVNEEWGVTFDVRLGINTGLVVVGAIGSDLRMEYTAMGDTINVAARMEQTAEPGTIRVTEETRRLVRGSFEFERVGEITVKGKQHPVSAYKVIRVREATARGRSYGRRGTEFVGRDAEMAALKEALVDVRQGVGQIVAVIGEAGIGKSRLVRELRRTGDGPEQPAQAGIGRQASSLQWYEVSSLSYEADKPYTLFQDLLRQIAGVPAGDPPERVLAKGDRLLAPFTDRRLETARQILATLLGVKTADDGLQLQGETFKRRLYAVMEEMWTQLVSDDPTILVLDDLHWADRASVELLSHLLPLVDTIPLLVLCAFRPDRRAPSWELKITAERELPHRYGEIRLSALSPDKGRQLATKLMASELPEEVAEQIMELSAGNPLFIEEVVQELLDRGALRREEGLKRPVGEVGDVTEIGVPNTLQSLLLARLDRLQEDARHSLQVASVIGRRFQFRVLDAVMDQGASLTLQLAELQRQGMIREEARIPEREYAFRQTLTHEVAYRSILRRQRRILHLEVAKALEELFSEQIEEIAPLLAHHYYRADHERALSYSVMAGDRAERLYANVEAITHYQRALVVALSREDTSVEEVIDLYLSLGRAMEHASRFEDAFANYAALDERGRSVDEATMRLAAVIQRAKLTSTATELFDAKEGQALIDQGLQMAREVGDRKAQAKLLWLQLNLHRLTGRDSEALEAGERSLKLMRKVAAQSDAGRSQREQFAYTMHDLAHVYRAVGDFKRGSSLTAEASKIWRELGNLPMLADSLASAVLHPLARGEYERAIAVSDEAFELSQSIDNRWNQSFSRLATGIAYQHLGQMARAIEVSQECVRLGREAGFPVPLVFTQPIIASVYIDLGAYERADALLQKIEHEVPEPFAYLAPVITIMRVERYLQAGDVERARDLASDLNPTPTVMDLWRGGLQLARLALAENKPQKALALLEERHSTLEEQGIQFYIPLLLYLTARAHLGLEQSAAAFEALSRARRMAGRMKQRVTLWRILALLADLEEAHGRHDDALASRRRAQEIVVYIADHAGNDDLRDSFLALPEVRRLHSFSA